MRAQSSTRVAALAALVGALACAGNTAKTDTDQAAAARDSTSARDTTQNPSGYRGMERDTSMVPPTQQTPTDTFLQRQGTGGAQDTSGYSGMERVDTTGQGQSQQGQGQNQQGQSQTDTSGMTSDTSAVNPSSQSNPSSAGQSDSTSMNQSSPSSSGQSDSSSQSNPSSTNQSGTSSNNQSGTSSSNQSGTALDSTGMSKTGDTTGYGNSQQGQDSTSHQ
jgi:hypothetical protein